MVKQDDLTQSINITEMVYFPIQRIDLHFDLIPGMKKPCTVLNKNERWECTQLPTPQSALSISLTEQILTAFAS